MIDVTSDEENSWTDYYPVYKWKWRFGQGIGGSSLVNIGVYTRGNLKDYEDWGGEQWSMNTTLELYKNMELSDEAPGYDVDYNFHPRRNKRGFHVSLVSPQMNEVSSIFKDMAEIWNVNIAKYRVDPHGKTYFLIVFLESC